MRLLAWMRVVVMAAGASMWLGGCQTKDPPYRDSDIAFDDRLLGEWTVQRGGDPEEEGFLVKARTVKFENGRVTADRGVFDPVRHNAYTVEVRLRDPESVLERGATEPRTMPVMSAFLIKGGDGLMMLGGMQPRERRWDLVVPYHMLVRLQVQGDQMKVWMPKGRVVWLAGVAPLDGDGESIDAVSRPVPSSEELRSRSKDQVLATSSIDRIVQVYRAHLADESFWDEEPMLYRRVKEGN